MIGKEAAREDASRLNGSGGADMREAARPMIAAQCECADCRQYRLWRVEGNDEWQPDRDGWNARSMGVDAFAVDIDAAADAGSRETAQTY
jgi:hypothetical protein